MERNLAQSDENPAHSLEIERFITIKDENEASELVTQSFD